MGYRVVALRQVEFYTIKMLIDRLEENSVHLHKFLGDQQLQFYENMSFQLEKVWVLL